MLDQHGEGTRGAVSLSERLQDVTEALAAARSAAEVYAVVLEPALTALGAMAGAVLRVNAAGDRLEIAADQGSQARAQTIWQDGPLTDAVPAGDALHRHQPLFFEHAGQLLQAYPDLEARTGAPLPVASAVLPMFEEGAPLGVITLDFREPHDFDDEERRFLRILAGQCALALGRARATQNLEVQIQARTAELEARTVALEEERAALDAFVVYKEAVGSERDVQALARLAAQVVQANLEGVSVAYYERDGDLWRAVVWSEDVSSEVVEQMRAGIPLAAPTFAQAIRAGEAVFADAWDAGSDSLPGAVVYGAAAFVPLLIQGEPHSIFAVGTRQARRWNERERAIVRAVARGLSVTLERTEQARQLDEERAALEAFARFTEASTQASDVLTLAEQASSILRATLNVQVGYSEREDGLWKGRVFSEDVPEHVRRQSREGVLVGLPSVEQALQTGEAVFMNGWDAQGEAIQHSRMYGAAGLYPYFEEGQPRGLLTIGTLGEHSWTERERSVFRSVGRSLALAFERLKQTMRLEVQNAELDARTRAVEAFAELTRDLTTLDDPYVFMQRAQQVALSLLPPGYALYFEPDGDRWTVRAQTGGLGNAALQNVADAGLPYHETNNLLTPFTTLAPYYQDQYDRSTDNLDDLVGHVGASATLPVLVEGRPVGVFAVALFGERRPWAPTDRAVLEGVVRALGLATERSQATRQLEEERAALEAFTAFTEAAGSETDVLILSRQAFEVLRARFSDTCTSVYYEVVGSRFYARSWSEDIDDQPELLAALTGGTPLDAPLFAEAVRTGAASFTAQWDPERDQIAHTEAYGAAAVYPLKVGGELRAFMGLGLRRQRNWTERDAAMFRSVGRGLTLALERAEVVAQLAQRTRELERSNAELEQFAYVASHDLQEPLRTVTSFSQLLVNRTRGQNDPKIEQYVRFIGEGTERMGQLIQDLLAFSRVATQGRPLQKLDPGRVVAQVVQDLNAQIERSGARVVIGDLPSVLADATQVRQLLQNLIGNALKFTSPERTPEVRVEAVPNGSFVRFTVRDNGLGIGQEFYERIFTIFQRLHNRTQYEGSGIGLAIARKIVERHGGQIWLESTPGAGTSFFFTLPAA